MGPELLMLSRFYLDKAGEIAYYKLFKKTFAFPFLLDGTRI
jgi:hypothetical protein